MIGQDRDRSASEGMASLLAVSQSLANDRSRDV